MKDIYSYSTYLALCGVGGQRFLCRVFVLVEGNFALSRPFFLIESPKLFGTNSWLNASKSRNCQVNYNAQNNDNRVIVDSELRIDNEKENLCFESEFYNYPLLTSPDSVSHTPICNSMRNRSGRRLLC
jgi:hypothetical protein